MNFNNLKVKNKITIVIISVAFLASISGIVSVFLMGNIQRQYDAALKDYGFAQGDIGIAMATLAELDGEVHDAIGYLDGNASMEAANKRAELIDRVDEYLAKVEPALVSESTRKAFNDAQTAWTNYQSISDDLVNLTYGVTDAEIVLSAQGRLRNELDGYFENMYNSLKSLMDIKVQQGDEAASGVANEELFCVIAVA